MTDRLSSLLRQHWFLAALIAVLVVGFLLAKPLKLLADLPGLKWSVVSVTMFVMAWPLELRALLRNVSKPLAPMLATLVNFVFIPLVAWPISPLLGHELGIGFLVAAATPTTLATGAVWTRRAGGDDSIAIVVTIITNSLCFLVTPLWVFAMTGSEMPRELLGDTIWKLLLFVVTPIVLSQLVRAHRPSAIWATMHKTSLSIVAQIGVLVMTGIGAISTGLRVAESEGQLFDVGQLALMLVAVMFVHGVALSFGGWLARMCGLRRKAEIAVAISGSQKTLMIGLSTAINLGVSILPMVAYHALQLIYDTVIADRFRQQTVRLEDDVASAPPAAG